MKTKLYFLFFLFFSFLGWNSVESISEKLESCSTRKFFGNAIILLNGLGWVRGQVDLSCSCAEQELPALLYRGARMEFRKGGEKTKKKLVLKNLISCCHSIPSWNYNSLFLLGVLGFFWCFFVWIFFFFEMYCKCQNKLFPLYHALLPLKEVCC